MLEVGSSPSIHTAASALVNQIFSSSKQLGANDEIDSRFDPAISTLLQRAPTPAELIARLNQQKQTASLATKIEYDEYSDLFRRAWRNIPSFKSLTEGTRDDTEGEELEALLNSFQLILPYGDGGHASFAKQVQILPHIDVVCEVVYPRSYAAELISVC
ncbi:hypothetical protein DFP72DRAFT_862066 [Ephemerocybe angulata]|uniref:Uncharacterized protein n=1 Tax=Ephemerocybe angulata TaxID=980116 RepID=A0A8H6H6T1_9AGAR|nr:hypothetical protein DFP72DRAFT_862066 [Tulosesus angulatus]